MHENAICQHRRDSTYTVPYVPADWICAARQGSWSRASAKHADMGHAEIIASCLRSWKEKAVNYADARRDAERSI